MGRHRSELDPEAGAEVVEGEVDELGGPRFGADDPGAPAAVWVQPAGDGDDMPF